MIRKVLIWSAQDLVLISLNPACSSLSIGSISSSKRFAIMAAMNLLMVFNMVTPLVTFELVLFSILPVSARIPIDFGGWVVILRMQLIESRNCHGFQFVYY